MSAVSYNVDALNGGLAGHIPVLFLPALRHARFQLTELSDNVAKGQSRIRDRGDKLQGRRLPVKVKPSLRDGPGLKSVHAECFRPCLH